MKIAGSVALVTGANRGLGRAYAGELVRRGAAIALDVTTRSGPVTSPQSARGRADPDHQGLAVPRS
jgi:NAD(P)-dependent dehydrogenase (short-subunit alcohol dehydrogenase family)